MTDPLAAKDASLAALVDALTARLGDAFVVVDHWPDDPFAVGIASPQDQGVLAYVSSFPDEVTEKYFVSLELPPGGEREDSPYSPGDERNVCGTEEVLAMVAEHIRRTPPNKSLERTRER